MIFTSGGLIGADELDVLEEDNENQESSRQKN